MDNYTKLCFILTKQPHFRPLFLPNASILTIIKITWRMFVCGLITQKYRTDFNEILLKNSLYSILLGVTFDIGLFPV